jgi:uncharacterized protein HemY
MGKLAAGTLSILLLTLLTTTAIANPSVFVSEGKYSMGDLDSKKDGKVLAIMDAKRTALEQAGTYIESSSEVKDFKLSKDQINTLVAGVMSVEVLKEDCKMIGENMVITVQIRATIDTSNLKDRIEKLHDVESTENYKEMQNQLDSLQKQLAELKTQRQDEIKKGIKSSPSKGLKEKHANIVNQMSALEYNEKGQKAIEGKHWEDAVTAFDRAIQINPRNVNSYSGKAYALYMLKKKRKAISAINKALDINPRHARNMGLKALILKDQPGQTDAALKLINSAIVIKPNLPWLYRVKGEIFVMMKKNKMARNEFNTACKMGGREACNRLSEMSKK